MGQLGSPDSWVPAARGAKEVWAASWERLADFSRSGEGLPRTATPRPLPWMQSALRSVPPAAGGLELVSYLGEELAQVTQRLSGEPREGDHDDPPVRVFHRLPGAPSLGQ